MTKDQAERLLRAAENISRQLNVLAMLEHRRFHVEHPPEGEQVNAEVIRVGEELIAEPQSAEEYEEFPSDRPGKFEQLLRQMPEG